MRPPTARTSARCASDRVDALSSDPGDPDRTGGDDFVSAVLAVVARIPPGRVLAYGDVAAELGSRAARAVGTVMARYGSDSPWWRVVRSGGRPPIGLEDRAREHYLHEGTPLVSTGSGYRIDMPTARWRP